MSLCFRCEYRARFLESREAPRHECSQADASVSRCYMYRPVSPCATVVTSDDRPASWRMSPPAIRPREEFSRVVGPDDCVVRAVQTGKEIVLYVVPKDADQKDQG